MNGRRRGLVWTGAGVVVLLVGLMLAEISGWPFLRQPIEAAASRNAAVPVQLRGRFRAHLLWRPRLEVEHLNIASAERFGAPHLLDAHGVSLAWRWGDVWRWQRGERLRLQALRADTLDARLRRLDDGTANWQLGAREPRPEEAEAEPLGGLPRFGSLVIGQGRVDWKDPVADVDVDIRLRGREGEAEAATSAGYEATANGRYRAMPLKLQVRAGSTLPLLQDPDTATDAPWVPVRVEGAVATSRLLFDGQAAALLGTPRLQGALELQGRSLAAVGRPLGITLPQTPPFDLRGTLSQDAGVWRLQATRANVGTSRLSGDLRFHSLERPRRLSGELTGKKLAFADLGPAIGASGDGATDAPGKATGKATGNAKAGAKDEAAQPASARPRRVLPQRRFDLPSLAAMDADVRVAINEVDFGTPAMTPLSGLLTRVRLSAGVLRLDELEAKVAGGRIKGMTQLDANARPAKWEATLDIAGVDVANWVRGLRREQASPYLTGVLHARLDVRGAGSSTAQILGSLDGPIDLRLRDGTLSYLITEAMGLDLAQALGVVITGDKPLPLRCARFDLLARNGVVEPRLAVLDNRDSTVRINGQVNLNDESLALRLVTQPKDWSPLSLRTPVTVTGTLGDPDVGIEGRKLAGRVIGAIALGAAAGPAAAVIPLVERGQKEEGDPCDAKAAAPLEKKR
ncbi:MAG TPA: AsmA family protein [Hydrogenophaga sp.]|uniref:AsmA family protein n=1 Tax=Hydrogenophaga sp. TaxID=1904254 RepID=UPI002C315B54|nr:AsmA family protein [Hydrogenophaga sp.]HSX93874.1 AsmA family protein [Hydrogenophaga sp.]